MKNYSDQFAAYLFHIYAEQNFLPNSVYYMHLINASTGQLKPLVWWNHYCMQPFSILLSRHNSIPLYN